MATSSTQTRLPPLVPQAIQDQFHGQVLQHGHALISFITEELQSTPLAISITLERFEFPESQVNWVRCVGTSGRLTEQAMLRFFQSDAGKAALASDNSPDSVEFKLASILLRLPADEAEDLVIPLDFSAATSPMQGGQKVVLMSGSAPNATCVTAWPNGWLQVSPHRQFAQLAFLKLQGEATKYTYFMKRIVIRLGDFLLTATNIDADTGILRALVVDPDSKTVYGRVAGIVGGRGVLVTPFTQDT